MSEWADDLNRNPPLYGTALTEDDYAELAKSWIPKELADAAMLRRVTAENGRLTVGQKNSRDCSGIQIPYYWPGEPSPFTTRIRRDKPEWEIGKDGLPKSKGKYLGPPDGRNRLYITPVVTLAQLADPALPLVIVEGEKKALALRRLANHQADTPRFVAVAISGVWNFRGKIGKSPGPNGGSIDIKGPIPDLARVGWTGRKVFIVFDADVVNNTNVRIARSVLAREVRKRQASPLLIDLPSDANAHGVDELLATRGPEFVLDLFAKAQEPTEQTPDLNDAQRLLALAGENKLFHTPGGEAFCQIQMDEHNETWILRSRGFKRWLLRRFFETYSKPPRGQALQDALATLDAKAQNEGEEAPLFVRVAGNGNVIYIDLCDSKWRAVEINARGWRVTSQPPVFFRRSQGNQPLPLPAKDGSLQPLRCLINAGNDNNWILCLAWLVAACRPTGPFPILIVQGEQGSAKSTMVKLLRRIVDPSSALIRTPPREERDLVISANNSWVIAYDNLSGIPQWLSDGLCRLATGGGFATRELYTDADEIIFDATRPIMLNGIDHLAERADLADRALILNLPRIENTDRKDEGQINRDFSQDLPKILGGLFSAVSRALARLPQTKLDSKPRMADFALWATAAEVGLGLQEGAFMGAYAGNRTEAIKETIESDIVGAALLGFIDELQGPWEGNCKELLHLLDQSVDERTRKSRSWPNSPRGLSSRLRRLVTFFRESGVNIVFQGKVTGGLRAITITSVGLYSTATTATTAAHEPTSSPNQSIADNDQGGGLTQKVAVAHAAANQPPPGLAGLKPLVSQAEASREAVVAVAAVGCKPFPPSSPDHHEGRTDLCANCQKVDWEWNANHRKWLCPHCGEPAKAKKGIGS